MPRREQEYYHNYDPEFDPGDLEEDWAVFDEIADEMEGRVTPGGRYPGQLEGVGGKKNRSRLNGLLAQLDSEDRPEMRESILNNLWLVLRGAKPDARRSVRDELDYLGRIDPQERDWLQFDPERGWQDERVAIGALEFEAVFGKGASQLKMGDPVLRGFFKDRGKPLKRLAASLVRIGYEGRRLREEDLQIKFGSRYGGEEEFAPRAFGKRGIDSEFVGGKWYQRETEGSDFRFFPQEPPLWVASVRVRDDTSTSSVLGQDDDAEVLALGVVFDPRQAVYGDELKKMRSSNEGVSGLFSGASLVCEWLDDTGRRVSLRGEIQEALSK